MGGATNKHQQNYEDAVQAMPGIKGTGRQGLHMVDDRVRTESQGEAEITVYMPGVR